MGKSKRHEAQSFSCNLVGKTGLKHREYNQVLDLMEQVISRAQESQRKREFIVGSIG